MRKVRAFAPGRTELAGNHTDHQGGRVIAAAVDCGIEVVASASESGRVHVESAGFDPVEFDAADVAFRGCEKNTTAALVRGVVAGLRDAGVDVGGFDAQVLSTVAAGSGLSSSAAFELALSRALELLFEAGAPDGSPRRAPSLSAVDHALIGQRAERDYFGKMCGLMDQLAVALGGIAAIDFHEEGDPAVEPIDFDFGQAGYAMCLIDAHCDHSDYTDEYSQVALDMFEVAKYLGAPVLSRVPEEGFLARFEEVRARLGDAPALRALHYYHEMRLVGERARALSSGDIRAFVEATRRSGASSAQYLQNVSTADRAKQPAMVALALADFAAGADGACRIHGGGFGGTIQAFVPAGRAAAFAEAVDARLGAGSCKAYRVGGEGASAQWL